MRCHAYALVGAEFVYCDLRLLAWVNGVMHPHTVEGPDAATDIAALISFEPTLPLLFDCNGIKSFGSQVLSLARAALDSTRPVLFWDCQAVGTEIFAQCNTPRSTLSVDGKEVWVYGKGSLTSEYVHALPAKIAELCSTTVRKAVAGSFRATANGHLTRMESTPLLVTGLFDARHFFTAPGTLTWIGGRLARLAEQICDANLDNPAPRRVQLLAVSLRASPLAGAVAELTGFHDGLHIVDHVGPKHRILETYSLGSTVATDFIYVADFIMGGTELKVARSYAGSLGGKVIGSVAVGSLLDESDYHFETPVKSLVCLVGLHPQFKVGLFPGELVL